MQTTLLGLGLALIAAIVAAFAAPFFIDWNEWRPELEAQASALAGTRVTISGNIDLTLLPTPAFVLRNVSLGDATSGTGMQASEMRGSLSLPALLSGKIEADEFVVSKPAIRLVIEKDGKFLLPAGASAGQDISVSGFVLEAGSLTIEDRRTNSVFLMDDFSARGELVSREGPFRLEGGFRLNGARWILRASSGRFGADHAGKVRLALERPADRITFEAEGLLALALNALRFEGKILAVQQGGALPWRVSAEAAGDASEVRLSNLELALGQGELPITLSGEAKFGPRTNGSLEAILTSKRIDLDLGDQKAPATGAGHVFPLLREAQRLLGELPFPSQVAVSADGILAGGQLMRDVRVNLRAQAGVVVPERFEARLPGRAAISFAGKRDDKGFSGPLSFESEEPQIFARWLLGQELAERAPQLETLRVNASVTWSQIGLEVEKIKATLGATVVNGTAGVILQDTNRWLLHLALELAGPDFGNLALIGTTNNLPFDVWAEIDAKDAKLLGKSARRVKFRATLEKRFELHAASISDFDGFSLDFRRGANIDGHEFEAEAIRNGGFSTLVEHLVGGADFAAIVTRYAESHFPLRLKGTVTPILNGRRLLVKSGDTALALDLGDLRDARRSVEGVMRLPETEISAKGEFRFGADGRFEPVLALNLKSADLRKAFVLADRASADVLPASGSANLVRDGNNLALDKLAIDLAGSRVTGRIAVPVGELSPFSGALSLDQANASALVSLALGRAHVSYVELGVPLLANFPGTLKMEIGSLAVSERIFLQKAAFLIRAGRYETVFDDFQAQLAGGKLSGSLRVADTFPRVVEINLNATDVVLPQLLAAKNLRGTLRGTLALSANGNTEDELIASLSGQGTLGLSNLEIEQTDATAVSTVFASAARETPDEKKIEQALVTAFERAPLKVSKVETSLVATNGILRSGSAKAKAGNIEIILSGSLNLPKRSVEALLNIEVAGDTAAKPGAVIRWHGPPDAPERKVDARALITAITLRAIERGGQNPANISMPQEERVPPPVKKKRVPAKSDVESAPLLPPPANIPPAPQPRSQN